MARARRADAAALSPRRIGFVLVALMVLFALVTFRTVYLQVAKTRTLSEWAQKQQQNETVLPMVRGDILDRNGQELAVGEERITFYASPRLIEDRVSTSIRLAELLKLGTAAKEQLLARINEPGVGFVYVARKVPRQLADKVIAEKLDGIGYFEEEQRVYPLSHVASQLLGYAGTDNRGLAGIESLYDASLSGRPGKQVIVRDPGGVPLDVLKLQREVDGRNVQLTLDATIQTQAERVLKETVARWRAKGATAIVMNPRNGEILAMANVPVVDANRFGDAPRAWQRNRAVTDTYEPGSTFKVVTVSGALEDKTVTPTMSFVLPPFIQVADRKIKESHSRPTVRLNTRQILIESSNVGTITIGLMMGKERLDHWIREFGFGSLTGIDFPGEVPGLMLDTDDWSGSTIGNVPIGQGIGVTAVQLAAAYATIANDGVLVEPHLLRRVEGEPAPRRSERRVISERTSRIMRSILAQVVTDERGTGNFAQIPGYEVGGKTGTANKAENGIYIKGKYSASFVGFVPARNPQLVTLVVVDEPSTPWGGVVAAPAFEEITKFALQYLAIPPDGRVGEQARTGAPSL